MLRGLRKYGMTLINTGTQCMWHSYLSYNYHSPPNPMLHMVSLYSQSVVEYGVHQLVEIIYYSIL